MKNKKALSLLLSASLLLSLYTPSVYAKEIAAIEERNLADNSQLTPQTKKTEKSFSDDFQLTPAQETELQEAITEEIDKHIVKATNQLKKIDSELEELALVVSNGIARAKNKPKIIFQIKSLRKFISTLVSNPYSEANIMTINFLLTLNNHLINNIYKAIQGGLKNIPDIDPEKIIPKKRITSTEQLEIKYIKNEKLYLQLRKAVQSAGLSLTSKAYRKFFVAPARIGKKYHVDTIAKWAVIGGIISAYVLYRFTDKLKNKLGEAPTINEYGRLDNEDELGKLGKFEAALYATERMPIAKFLLATTPILLYPEFKKIKRWVNEKATQVHYHLMGGVQRKEAAQKYDFTTPRYTFDDVVGLEHVKEELRPLVEYIKNNARFNRIGIGAEKGILFAGKPGTGKSFVAEALAGEIAKALQEEGASPDTFRFIPFEASEVFDIIQEKGVTDGVDAIFSFAMKNAPCIVFIDEPDLMGLQRTANKELLSKILNVMNGFLSNNLSEDIILLAATNRPDNLDPALLRAGRFGKIIHFEYPNFETRKQYLIRRLNPIVADINEFDIEKLAKETKSTTLEGLKSMIRKAFQETKIKGNSLTQEALEKALDQEIRQILPNTKRVSEKEQRIIAAQQAAAALASMLLDPSDKLACVTINPVMRQIRESSVWDRFYKEQDMIVQQGKIFTYRESDTEEVYSQDGIVSKCKISLAGSIGEEILLGSSGHSYNKANKDEALATALSYVSEGLDFEKMPKKVQDKFYEQALEFMQECKEELKELLEENKEDLVKISNALLKHKTLNREQVQEIISLDSEVVQSIKEVSEESSETPENAPVETSA